MGSLVIGFDLDGVMFNHAKFKVGVLKELHGIDLEEWKLSSNVIDEYLSKLSSVTSTDFKHLNIDPLKLFFPNGIPYDRILEELSKIDLSKVKFKEGFDVSSWFSGLSKELWNIEKDLNPIYEQIFGNLQTMTRTQILAAIRVAKETLKNADLTDVQQTIYLIHC